MARGQGRWWKKTIGIVVAVGLLFGAGELALRLLVPSIVQGQLRSQLGLTKDHPVDVSMGGSAVLHALGGGLGDVTVTVPDMPLIDGVVADATVHVERMPFDPTSGELSDPTAELTVDKERLGDVIDLLTQGIAQSGAVRGDDLEVGRDLEVFGQTVSLAATIHLSVVDGDVLVEPRGAKVAGFNLDTEQISSATGSLLDPVLQTQTVCVRDRLPVGVTLTDITLSSTGAVTISADLAPNIMTDKAQQQLGACESR